MRRLFNVLPEEWYRTQWMIRQSCAAWGWDIDFISFQFLICVLVVLTVFYKCVFTSEHCYIAAECHGHRQNRSKLIKTSRPKASRGQQYPCSAISCGAEARQGSGPKKGRCPVEQKGEIPSIHLPAHLSKRWLLDSLSQPWGGTYGWTYGWTYRYMHRWNFPPLPMFDRTSSPIGSTAQKGEKEWKRVNFWQQFQLLLTQNSKCKERKWSLNFWQHSSLMLQDLCGFYAWFIS